MKGILMTDFSDESVDIIFTQKSYDIILENNFIYHIRYKKNYYKLTIELYNPDNLGKFEKKYISKKDFLDYYENRYESIIISKFPNELIPNNKNILDIIKSMHRENMLKKIID